MSDNPISLVVTQKQETVFDFLIDTDNENLLDKIKKKVYSLPRPIKVEQVEDIIKSFNVEYKLIKNKTNTRVESSWY